ncbi:MAG: hypothetical protein PVF17_00165 [Ignavibacteria bacterium]|jgi:hypothetical protein
MKAPNVITLNGSTYYKVKDHNVYHWEVRALYKKEDTDDYILYMYDTTTEYLDIKVPSMSYVEHIMEDK